MMQYIAVTNDKYELPFACSDTAIGLAKMLGITPNAVSSAICRSDMYNGRIKGYKIIGVRIDDYIDPLDLEDNKE